MLILSASPVKAVIESRVRDRASLVTKALGRAPTLAVVIVGNDPASLIYTKKKGEQAIALGLNHETISFPDTATPLQVKAAIQKLNDDPSVDGILIQRPLPKSFLESEVVYWVSPAKDVDAFHPETVGRLVLGLPCFQPCTPAGVMEILKHYKINPAGKVACIIGRSSIVGKPMASLLLQADATVLQCHSKTSNLISLTQLADILVVAAGKPEFIDASYLKDNAVVIDVGIHRTSEGKITGDVLFEDARQRASAMTPVPGGVGPMTIALLLQNTVTAAEISLRSR